MRVITEKRREQVRRALLKHRAAKYARDPKWRSKEAREKKYGLNPETLTEILKSCKGRCQVCSAEFDEVKREPCVDHCHETGVIRGLLCQRCNVAEGALNTPENARKLYEYMLANELFYSRKVEVNLS